MYKKIDSLESMILMLAIADHLVSREDHSTRNRYSSSG